MHAIVLLRVLEVWEYNDCSRDKLWKTFFRSNTKVSAETTKLFSYTTQYIAYPTHFVLRMLTGFIFTIICSWFPLNSRKIYWIFPHTHLYLHPHAFLKYKDNDCIHWDHECFGANNKAVFSTWHSQNLL